MQPEIILSGINFFLAALIIHLGVWRFVDVKKEILLVLIIFLALPLLSLVLFCFLGVWTALDTLAIGILVTSLGIVYVQTYPALRTNIPTFRILLLIQSKGKLGLTESEIVDALIGSKHMFSHKVVELEMDRLAVRKNGRVYLTKSGEFTVKIFMIFRSILGLPTGAG